MKITFVRGPHLNPWELQTYMPLAHRHFFTAVGADWQFYNGPFEATRIHIQKASVWGARLGRLCPTLFVLYNRALSWTLGQSYGFYDLDTFAKEAAILHSAETFSTMTYQCLQIRRKNGCKVVATVWENLPHMGETHPLRRARKQRALKEVDGFLAVTETSRRMLLEEGVPSERIAVIPMAVDAERFSPQPKDPAWLARLGFSADDVIILFIGRFVKEKGVKELIEAIPKVRSRQARARFCFVGAGPLQQDLSDAQKRWRGTVAVQPFVSYDQVPTLHQLADIFVLPSKPAPKWQEQFGYVLVESMAYGKPVITTRTGSIPDVVGNAALLVEPGDSDALTSKILELVSAPETRKRLGEAARQRVEAVFDVNVVTLQLERFYEKALGGRPVGSV